MTSGDFDHVAVDDVSRHFGRRRAVSRVSFTARAGTILGLLGPNGAGKSTLLAMLATLLKPTSGIIRFGSLDPRADGAGLRGRIGILGHDLFLYPELTASENLAFFAGLYRRANPSIVALRALDQAGLADRAGDQVISFSRGMRQRVALERALIHEPRLALLDEPFTGLDDASAAALVRRLGMLKASGTIVILATHDLDLAEGLLDNAVFLRDGRVAAVVSRPERLRATYRDVMGA
ncbi:MAG: ABC transporter ATP-binding protein [Vicinamibacterales bacterium]